MGPSREDGHVLFPVLGLNDVPPRMWIDDWCKPAARVTATLPGNRGHLPPTLTISSSPTSTPNSSTSTSTSTPTPTSTSTPNPPVLLSFQCMTESTSSGCESTSSVCESTSHIHLLCVFRLSGLIVVHLLHLRGGGSSLIIGLTPPDSHHIGTTSKKRHRPRHGGAHAVKHHRKKAWDDAQSKLLPAPAVPNLAMEILNYMGDAVTLESAIRKHFGNTPEISKGLRQLKTDQRVRR
eukprot:CAMPEP_0198197368 /NCGR_PEP_ID=MMETSP1445-20131203/993_1 /TAXON_ID=36898 /ORGANISM="Pyramimonas sp., Strain CCMP2087" /LENGTH=235 /DNA_ID=CAMNT_0043866639 /DNA_START=580 /DNA_END=1285 /DNA_ORIENTATION=-